MPLLHGDIGKSTLSAETLALESLETCFIMKSLLVELIGRDSFQKVIPICCYSDKFLQKAH